MNEPIEPRTVTRLLLAHRDGDRSAFDELVPLIYPELKRIAARQLGGRTRGETLSPTSLVHEAYLRLVDETAVEWADRAHFFAIASRTMRRVLIDAVRASTAQKRGGKERVFQLGELDIATEIDLDLLLSIDQALERLEAIDTRLVRVVECRWFAGMSEQETAGALQLPLRSTQRCWMRARAWLRHELEPRGPQLG